MSDSRTIALIEDLRALSAETAWAEFKQDNTDPERIGRLISALANAARIADQETGYIVWGIRNSDHAITGTAFEPASTKRQRQPLEHWLTQHLRPDLAFSFEAVKHPEGRLVLLSIPSATTAPRRVQPHGVRARRRGNASTRRPPRPSASLVGQTAPVCLGSWHRARLSGRQARARPHRLRCILRRPWQANADKRREHPRGLGTRAPYFSRCRWSMEHPEPWRHPVRQRHAHDQ